MWFGNLGLSTKVTNNQLKYFWYENKIQSSFAQKKYESKVLIHLKWNENLFYDRDLEWKANTI